jgi:hypothetical protein
MQPIHPLHIIIILVACTIVGGCVPTYYISGRVPTPQFDSSCDAYVAAGGGAGGWQGDVAAAPMDNFWIAGHISYLPFTDSISSGASGSSLGQFYGEFGLGWYSSGEGRQFGLLAGYGRGRSLFIQTKIADHSIDTIESPPEIGEGDFETYFLQGSGIALRTTPNTYFRLLVRGEYIRFRHFTLDGIDQPRPTAVLVEPRILFGAKNPDYPGIQFEMQIGFQFRVGGRARFEFHPLHISLAFIGLLDLL